MIPTHALTFGALNLIGSPADVATQGYWFGAEGDDADWGNQVPITQAIVSWLQDGAIVALQGYDNRDMFIRVRVSGGDDAALAAGEAALFGETGKRNLLIWTPPGVNAAASVFSVVMSNLELITDDLADVAYRRTYGLRITAEPFARSTELVTVSIPAPDVDVVQTSTTVDDASSIDDWELAVEALDPLYVGDPILFEGRLYGAWQNIPISGVTRLTLYRSDLAVSLATERYFRIDLSILGEQAAVTPDLPVGFFINDDVILPALQDGNIYWFDAAEIIGTGTTVVSFAVQVRFTSANSSNQVQVGIGGITQSNVLGDQTNYKQMFRTIPVAGAARTQGNLALVAEGEAGLGMALIYTCPAIPGLVQPSLRSRLVPGPTETPDEDTVSGAYSDLADVHTFDVPASGLIPGGHLLLVRFNGAEGDIDPEFATYPIDIKWSATSRQGAIDLPGNQGGTVAIPLLLGGSWQVHPVAGMNLPPRKLGADGVVRIELQCLTGDTEVGFPFVMDEAWLVNVETGRLTLLEAGDRTRLWLDAATVETPVPSVWLGIAENRSDSYHAGPELQAFGNHEFVPAAMNVFTALSDSAEVSMEFSHYPRFPTHVVAQP